LKLAIALVAMILLIPASAYAQSSPPGPSMSDIVDANYSGPVFQDAFWTNTKVLPPAGTSLAKVEVAPGDGTSVLAVVLVNRGFSDITSITGQLELPDGFSASGSGSGRTATASYNDIVKAGGVFTIFFEVDVYDSARVGTHFARLTVEFNRVLEVGSVNKAVMNVSFRLTGKAILDVNVSGAAGPSIVAGKIQDLAFTISNSGTTPVTSLVVTMSSQAEALKILGDSKWNLQRIDAGSQAELSTTVFAATQLIGNPASLDLTIEYMSNGQQRTERFALGTYIDGEIAIRAYEISVTYIGGRPNITGNLLNEGNVLALFTTINLVSAEGLVKELPPQQYLGDLSENSPLPFSIPVTLADGADAGRYPVKLQVQYKDTLKELHTFDVEGTVDFVPEAPATAARPAAGGTEIGIVAGIIAAAAIAVLVMRQRKRAALKRKIEYSKQNGSDIESVLDEQLKDRK
jgi:hypothetical protein